MEAKMQQFKFQNLLLFPTFQGPFFKTQYTISHMTHDRLQKIYKQVKMRH